ncbi:expressed unknown protein [Seminavis robusta]|uniref:Uncharacterized protein n=1 Tax=Seminavis robusta TaxID=568900 RepID=A0A9N8E289_9STRA|nr:expressed unknown protein [Seminavis robusta]|eukprot:Sro456_g146730.1 n/a (213) ;mRNA; r:49381-50019
MGSNDDDDDSPLGSGLGTILRFTGSNVPSRALYIGEAFVSASLFSVTIGLCFGSVGAVIFPNTCGPLVPFLTGSSIGYTFGLYEHYSSVKRNMLVHARHYPTLLAHAMWSEHKRVVPKSVMEASRQQEEEDNPQESSNVTTSPPLLYQPEVENVPLDQWVFLGGLGRLTWSMLASQNCKANVTAIEEQKRQRLVDSILQEHEGKNDDNSNDD